MKTIPVADLNTAAFLVLHGMEVEFRLIGTRISFEFPATPETYALLRQFQANPSVRALDFSDSIRRLRARMLAERPPRNGHEL